MHAWVVIAFILAGASLIVAAIGRAWALALLAASFASGLIPAALRLRGS